MLEKSEQEIEITSDMINSWRPMFCVPCYDQQVTEPFMMSMLQTALAFKDIGIDFSISSSSDSLITRGRNTLVAKFLANPQFTHMMFIDADIRWDYNDILKMLWHDKDIITGSYPIKNINWEMVQHLVKNGTHVNELLPKSLRHVVNPVDGKSGNITIENGIFRVRDAGTGFMLIKREALLKLIEAMPELKYNDDTGALTEEERKWTYHFFSDYVYNERLLSEDYGFCRYWQEIGGDIWVDPAIELMHIGRMRFTGSLIDYIGNFAKNPIESE